MAMQAWIAVKGAKQGQFKAEIPAAGKRIETRSDKWSAVLAFTMGVTSPRDPATGLPTGKRQYQAVTIVKQWGASSPQALAACANNEILTEVVIEFTRPSTTSGAADVVYQSVKLTNASFSQIARFTDPAGGTTDTPSAAPAATTDMVELERWSLTFQKIEVTDTDSKTAFDDTWSPASA